MKTIRDHIEIESLSIDGANDTGRVDPEGRVADLLGVLEVARRFAVAPGPASLLGLIEQAALRVLDCDRARVFVHDPWTGTLGRCGSEALDCDGGDPWPMGWGRMDEVLRRSTMVNLSDACGDFPDALAERELAATRRVLACPLLGWENAPIGVLQVVRASGRRFDDWDEVLAKTLLGQAGVLLQRHLERGNAPGFAAELELARQIERSLLPHAPPALAGFDIAGWNQPADATGGDFFDFQARPGGKLAVTVADVSGHGVGPALVVAECRAFLRATLVAAEEPAEVLTRVNRLVSAHLGQDRFVTAFFGLLDRDAHRLSYVSAGHGPLLFYRRASDTFRELDVQGFPLGMAPLDSFTGSNRIGFEPGDLLLVVTDGFYEWHDARGECFGVDRMRDRVARDRDRPAAEIIRSLHRAVLAFAGGTPQPDDLTAVVIKRML